MSKVTSRAVTLLGNDIVAILAIAKTCEKLPVTQAQCFLMSVWFDWRAEDDSCKNVMTGVGCFFDMYFAFHGDFAAIQEQVVAGLTPEQIAESRRRADALAATNLSAAEALNGEPMAEIQLAQMPAAATEAN